MQAVCKVADVPVDGAFEIRLDNQPVVIANQDGQFHAYVNWCPHLGIELNFMPDEFMDSDNRFLMCANHGALFEIPTGQCISGPCSGDSLVKVELEVRGDEIFLGAVPDPNA